VLRVNKTHENTFLIEVLRTDVQASSFPPPGSAGRSISQVLGIIGIWGLSPKL
jgi:hypothetical protein